MKIQAEHTYQLLKRLKRIQDLSQKIPLKNSLFPNGNNASVILYHVAEATKFWLQRILDIPSYRDNYTRLREFYFIPDKVSNAELDRFLDLKEPDKTRALDKEFEKAVHSYSKISSSLDEAIALIKQANQSEVSLNRKVDLQGLTSSVGENCDVAKILIHVYGHAMYHGAQLEAILKMSN